MKLITIDMDALAQAIDSNTDATEQEARAIINTVLYVQSRKDRMPLAQQVAEAGARLTPSDIMRIHDTEACLPDLVGGVNQWPEILKFARAVERAVLCGIESKAEPGLASPRGSLGEEV